MDLIRTKFLDFGLILTNFWQHFCKKWIPYESSGQIHRLKLMVYGLSLYDIFIKISDLFCIFQSTLRYFSKTLFFIWSRLRCVYSTHTICSTYTICSAHTMSPWQTRNVSVWKTHSPDVRGGRWRASNSNPTGFTNPHCPHTRLLSCAAGGLV